jgi:cytochrome d ubiquinol oxidase subunit II
MNGYVVTKGGDPAGFSNPLYKEVAMQQGAWLLNYTRYPFAMSAPSVGFLGALVAFLFARFGQSRFAFIASSFSIIGVIASIGVSMFPFILPSSNNYKSSLLVWDSSSTQLTLIIMLITVVIFMPIILIYTAWVYRALRGKITEKLVEENEHRSY